MTPKILVTPANIDQLLVNRDVPIPATSSVDRLIIDPDGTIGIDEVRHITRFLSSPPRLSPLKLVVINQAHHLTLQAQNAFLKTLEECPDYAQIQLITPRPQHLLPTILSRCLTHFLPSSADVLLLGKDQSSVIPSTTAGRVILAAKYAVSKEKADSFLFMLAHKYRLDLYHNPTSDLCHNLHLTHQALIRLTANANPKLTLTDTLLHLH